VAEDMLQHIKAQQQQKLQQRADFDTFMSRLPSVPVSDADREELFRQFLQWEARERN
jgi:hypothetical protein